MSTPLVTSDARRPDPAPRSSTRVAPTRERLLDAALELFAERGFADTKVGDIEAAAGLAPRAGGLYKHFSSKEEVLHAALERFVAEIEIVENTALEMLPLGDMRAELTLLARATMAHFSRQRTFLRIINQERARIPELLEDMHNRAVGPAYAFAADWVRRQTHTGLFPEADADALAAVIIIPFVGYRLEQNLFGTPPGDVDEERFVEAWVQLLMGYAKGGTQDGDS